MRVRERLIRRGEGVQFLGHRVQAIGTDDEFLCHASLFEAATEEL